MMQSGGRVYWLSNALILRRCAHSKKAAGRPNPTNVPIGNESPRLFDAQPHMTKNPNTIPNVMIVNPASFTMPSFGLGGGAALRRPHTTHTNWVARWEMPSVARGIQHLCLATTYSIAQSSSYVNVLQMTVSSG
jgi:hypothetical protein